MNAPLETYKILLDGRWALKDLTDFTRVYYQNYAFIYCLDTQASLDTVSQIQEVLREYELRSGATYVSIYGIFRHRIPPEDRPDVKSIKYASPGWMELALDSEVAVEVAKSVAALIGAGATLAGSYRGLQEVFSALRERRKARKNRLLQLDAEEVAIVQKLNKDLAKGLGFKSLKELDKYTKDPEESSKLLMAHYRRVKQMAKFVDDGKASFPIEEG
ncbi:hypothetical protein [Roseibacillus persicicus]|uniref:Uncharacterized protein n=1 Tax=Roseibacillus persicicus TaxID=454148 RepID=A0A918TZA7_9BACT|nr:hypothetical protein [Roseibacillus persicicus]GHC68221.1 hypothetical protein GCM10007100_40330 [Roseibacillus persicicus]